METIGGVTPAVTVVINAVGIDFENEVVPRFRNEQVSGAIHRHAQGRGQGGVGGRAPRARIGGSAAFSDRRDDAVDIDFENHMVRIVRDEQVACRVNRQPFGGAEAGRAAGCGHHRHRSVGSEPQKHGSCPCPPRTDCTRAIHRHAVWRRETRVACSAPQHRVDEAVSTDFANRSCRLRPK